MRRPLIILFAILLLACQAVTQLPALIAPEMPTPAVAPSATVIPKPTATGQAPATVLPDGAPFNVRYHPDGGLYTGDQVSFEIIAPPSIDVSGDSATVQVAGVQEIFGPEEFGNFGIARRKQATLTWAWDTRGWEPGNYDVTFSIQPEGVQWTETVALLPRSELPREQAGARWAQAESDCCLLYYITNTDAERDLEELLELADRQAAIVEGRYLAQLPLGESARRRVQAGFPQPVKLVILPRVLGHGGFTNSEVIAISYLDQRYSGGDPGIVLRHEMVHYLDNHLGGELRPTILVEGLAVYLSGGHFKEESILPRAAALLELGWYKPLASLAKDFYPSQHETGYLQAGALVDYMVERWGWEAFEEFYRGMLPDSSGSGQVQVMDASLQKYFGLRLDQLETGFIGWLQSQAYTQSDLDDLRLTVAFYDTVRRYQQELDPSAYYLTAWLPDGEQMRQRGIVADYLRHPESSANVLIEMLLVSADGHLQEGEYEFAERLLDAANGVLDGFGG